VTGICEETCEMEMTSEEYEQNIICFTNMLCWNLQHMITSSALYYYLRITNLYKLHKKMMIILFQLHNMLLNIQVGEMNINMNHYFSPINAGVTFAAKPLTKTEFHAVLQPTF
jgi:hypothetical protein